jgi:TatA/E family protein of Tat protein translocase
VDVPVLMFESPAQIAIVLLIALVVFGPKKLPEIGKQLGSALRELRKATSDVTRSFTTDYEPDPEPYTDHTRSYGTVDYGYHAPDYNAPPDLTDYTIAGLPPNDQAAYGYGDQEVEDAYAISASSSVLSASSTEPQAGAAETAPAEPSRHPTSAVSGT